MEIEFEEETHTYRKDGIIIPSVGFLLKEAGLIRFPPYVDKYLPGAAKRGREVHLHCESIDREETWGPASNPDYVPYVESYQRWVDEYQPTWYLTETVVFNDLVAGRLDRMGSIQLEGEEVEGVFDLKTSTQVYPHYRIQLAGYESLARPIFQGVSPSRRFVVHLNRNGKIAKNVEFTDEYDYTVFDMAVNLYAWRRREKLTEE